jgi:hypothetical protein
MGLLNGDEPAETGLSEVKPTLLEKERSFFSYYVRARAQLSALALCA